MKMFPHVHIFLNPFLKIEDEKIETISRTI